MVKNSLEVATIGESMVLFQNVQDGRIQYAPVLAKTLAGAESNVAIGLTRLGVPVRWVGRLGKDPFGDYIFTTLKGEGLDVSRVIRDANRPTGIMFKEIVGSAVDPHVFYYRKEAAASCWSAEEIQPDLLEGIKLLHMTGITAALSESSREATFQAIHLARQSGITVSFDPNCDYKLWGAEEARQTFKQLVAISDIVLPGIDEGELITGVTDPDRIAHSLLEMGAKIVILKFGPQGSGAYIRSSDGSIAEKFEQPGFPVERMVDSVGAGDGFAAGFLSAYLAHKPLPECLLRANAVGAMVTQFRGDWEGLPTLEEVERFIHRKSEISR